MMMQTKELRATLASTAPLVLEHDFNRIPVRPAPVALQTKLAVNKPGDEYEQEADRVANAVMRAHTTHAVPEGNYGRSGGMRIQRKCSDCEEKILRQVDKQEDEDLSHGPQSGEPTVDYKLIPPGKHAVSGIEGGGGQSLPPPVRGFFEARFGHDFSQVRLHADNHAAKRARGLNARAYTVGNDIYFGSGQYTPGTYSGDQLLAHELTHTIQQGGGTSCAVREAQSGVDAIPLSSAPAGIQRKEEVLAPDVTPASPLERLLNGDSDGLTTPFVNGVQISDTGKLDDALPTPTGYAPGSAANSCKVGKAIDIKSQAKIIAASAPGPKGWMANAPYATVQQVLGVNNADCAALKGNLNIRMVAKIGNKEYAKLVRTAEGDHEKVVKDLHNKYLKPYHDLVNSKVGSDKDLKKCAEGLAKEFRDAEVPAINNWATDWTASIDKFDGPNGPHTSKASVAVTGKCNEVVVTISR
jgi:hypothetical protein